jgi:hypothetical protein
MAFCLIPTVSSSLKDGALTERVKSTSASIHR